MIKVLKRVLEVAERGKGRGASRDAANSVPKQNDVVEDYGRLHHHGGVTRKLWVRKREMGVTMNDSCCVLTA